MCKKNQNILNDLKEGFTVLGTTDETSVCDLCGKTHLKMVYVLRTHNGSDYRLGKTCASREIVKNDIRAKHGNKAENIISQLNDYHISKNGLKMLETATKEAYNNRLFEAMNKSVEGIGNPLKVYNVWKADYTKQTEEPRIYKNVIKFADAHRVKYANQYNVDVDDIYYIPKSEINWANEK